MAVAFDDVFEWVTIRIFRENMKNMVSCIYRSPGSTIETFKERIELTFSRMQNYDFNINL